MKENKNSTIASLILHVILIIGLIGFKSAHILVPSRSEGIEVSLVSNDEVAPTSKSKACNISRTNVVLPAPKSPLSAITKFGTIIPAISLANLCVSASDLN